MGEVKGYICDRPGCDKFAAASKNDSGTILPKGWLEVSLSVVVPTEGGSPWPRGQNHGGRNTFTLCGSVCMALLALERAEAENERVPGWQRSKGGARGPYKKRERSEPATEAATPPTAT